MGCTVGSHSNHINESILDGHNHCHPKNYFLLVLCVDFYDSVLVCTLLECFINLVYIYVSEVK